MRSRAGGDALGAPHHPYANGPGVEGVADDFSSSAFDAENTHLSQVVHQQAVKNPGADADASGPKGDYNGFQQIATRYLMQGPQKR